MKPSILRQSSAPDVATDLARLTDALRVAAGGLIAFAFFDTFPARDSAMREVEQRLAGEVEVRHIELTPAEPYLHEKLHAPPPGRRLAYFVNGFEGLAGDAREQAFGALQVKREAIGRLEVPVVLWVAEENLAELARRAPDFYAWRAGLYDFRSHADSPERVQAFGRAIERMLGVH